MLIMSIFKQNTNYVHMYAFSFFYVYQDVYICICILYSTDTILQGLYKEEDVAAIKKTSCRWELCMRLVGREQL